MKKEWTRRGMYPQHILRLERKATRFPKDKEQVEEQRLGKNRIAKAEVRTR